MATFYVDLSDSSPAGHAGTTGDPYSLADFTTIATVTNSDTWKLKGLATIGNLTFYGDVLEAWNLGSFGPWRLSLSSSSIGLWLNRLSDGIINANIDNNTAPSSTIFTNCIFFKGLNYVNGTLLGCYLKGSSLSCNIVVKDSAIDGNFSFTTASFTNCISSAAALSNAIYCQFNYSFPSLPTWSDGSVGTGNHDMWKMSVLLPSITQPTFPGFGYPAYTGYATDQWGNTKYGIGTGFSDTAPTATTFYVNSTGTETFPYDTQAKAANTLSSLMSGLSSNSRPLLSTDNVVLTSDITETNNVTLFNTTVSSSTASNKKSILLSNSKTITLNGTNFKWLKVHKAHNDTPRVPILAANSYTTVDSCFLYHDSYSTSWAGSDEGSDGVFLLAHCYKAIIQNCVIHDVDEAISSGNVTGSGVDVAIINNTLYNVIVGVDVYFTTPPNTIKNNIFCGNIVSPSLSYPMFTHVGSAIYDYADNVLNFAHGRYNTTADPKCISADPLFVDTTNFAIQASSPCVDAGYNHSDDTRIPSYDIIGTTRPKGAATDIGAYEYFVPSTAINTFDSSAVSDGLTATSTLNATALISSIQTAFPGNIYFDTAEEVGQVYVYYTHEAGRQEKRVVHDPVSHQGSVSWSAYAQDGTWQKSKIKAFDKDGATVTLSRTDIGTAEDITHSAGIIYLNT